MKYWIQYVRQGVQGSSTNVEYSFRAENHQFDNDSLSTQFSNYLNLVTFEYMYVHFVFNVCSLMHDSTDHSHFHTEGGQLV